jgi:hypothetical protein
MPGMLIQQGAMVMCAHGGQGQPTAPNPAVMLSGMPSFLLSAPWTVVGCPGIPTVLPPCVTAMWTVGTTRVTSFGQPLLVQSSVSTCIPTGTPLIPGATQLRVTAM